MFGGGEMIAVEKTDVIAGHQGRQFGPQSFDDGADALRRFVDKCSRDDQFDVLEFVVDGLITNGDLLFERAVGGIDRGFLFEDDTAQEVCERGEEKFMSVLTSCSAGEQLIDLLRIEKPLQDSAGQASGIPPQ